MGPPPVEERARWLTEVLRREGVTCDPQQVREFAARHVDMRAMLRTAQKDIGIFGELRSTTGSLVDDQGSLFTGQGTD
jgi:hypothetical protein